MDRREKIRIEERIKVEIMLLQGTAVNILAIAAGALLGRAAGTLLSERVHRTIMAGLGLSVLLIGLQLGLRCQQPLIAIGSLLIGGLIGEWINIERRLEAFGIRLERLSSGDGVARGFVSASLLFCVGAMAIMGSIQDGSGNAPTILYAKSALDGIAAVALASTLGIGVLYSALPVLLYQGGITLVASSAAAILTTSVMTEMNAVGGLLIVAIGLDLLGIKRFAVGNLLPSVFVSIGLMWLCGLAGA